MKKVVILRPEPGASETERRAHELGLETAKIPLFEIEPIAWCAPDPGEFDGLLLTSANGIDHAGIEIDRVKQLPVYAVGPATAQAAEAAGLTVAKAGRLGVEALLRAIDQDLRLLHLAGEDRIDHRLFWQKITSIPVYRSASIEKVDLTAADGAVAMIHSPRAGRRLAELVADKTNVTIAAISKAAAAACGQGWGGVYFVTIPNDSRLLALAARLCEKPDPE